MAAIHARTRHREDEPVAPRLVAVEVMEAHLAARGLHARNERLVRAQVDRRECRRNGRPLERLRFRAEIAAREGKALLQLAQERQELRLAADARLRLHHLRGFLASDRELGRDQDALRAGLRILRVDLVRTLLVKVDPMTGRHLGDGRSHERSQPLLEAT